MASYGMAISRPGENVRTVVNKDLQFKSDFTTLKILKSGEVAFQTDGSGNGSLSVRHGLGFAPAFYVFRKGTASFSYLDGTSYSNCYFPNPEIVANQWISGTFSFYTTTSDLIISASSQLANTIYTFKYYIFIDLAQDYSSQQLFTLKNNYGIEITKPGSNVKTSKDYQKVYSNKYRSLQYYKESYKVGTLTIPPMNGVVNANATNFTGQTGTYVDIQHGLNYPPFYLVYAKPSTSLINFLCPFRNDESIAFSNQTYVNSWCDSWKIRVSLYRESIGSTSAPDGGGESTTSLIYTYKCFIFTEDLTTQYGV